MASLAAVAVLAGCGGNRAAAPPGLAPVDLGAAAVGFVGADVCKQCHSAAHAAWLTTKHHDALRFLAEVKQDRNPQCLPCHTVGFGKPGGYRSAQ
jgi:hypothetical protein